MCLRVAPAGSGRAPGFLKVVGYFASPSKGISRLKSSKEVVAKGLTDPGSFPSPWAVDTLGCVIDECVDCFFDGTVIVKGTKQFCDNVVNFECNLHSKRETCVSEVVSLFALFVVLGRRGQIF
jgi:hypothetical protein